jgi:DNA-binding NtrC family response regulator
MGGRVWLVDDQAEVRDLLARRFRERDWEVAAFAAAEELLESLSGREPADLAVLDLDLGPGRMNGLALLDRLRRALPDLLVVILTGKGGTEDAVRAIRSGAADFIEKDPDLLERLDLQMAKIERILAVIGDNRRLREQYDELRRRGTCLEMIGESRVMRAVREKTLRLADIPRPVLILGERGTGKELVALSLHRQSARRERPFVTVNCAALPETLAEAELFGSEPGAFTDARRPRPGRFQQADGGTLFLDEIGNMSLITQQKVLRAIEYQTFERVGGSGPVRVDVRVCAATNADLSARVREGSFRADLYDRLAFDTIRMPPLRERREDIPDLARFFLKRFREEVAGVVCQAISEEALQALSRADFPGNVRELKNLVERAAYRCQGPVLQESDLELAAPGAPEVAAGSFAERVAAFETQLIRQALDAEEGHLGRAAKRLGLGYDQARRLVRKHKIKIGPI